MPFAELSHFCTLGGSVSVIIVEVAPPFLGLDDDTEVVDDLVRRVKLQATDDMFESLRICLVVCGCRAVAVPSIIIASTIFPPSVR